MTYFQMATHLIFFSLPITVLLCILITFFHFKNYILKQNKNLWNKIKLPLSISLLPIFAVWHYLIVIFFAMAPMEGRNNNFYILISAKILLIFLISIILFSIFLWYKKLLNFNYIKKFIISLLIGIIFSSLFLFICVVISEYLARLNPDYRRAIEKLRERTK